MGGSNRCTQTTRIIARKFTTGHMRQGGHSAWNSDFAEGMEFTDGYQAAPYRDLMETEDSWDSSAPAAISTTNAGLTRCCRRVNSCSRRSRMWLLSDYG